MSSKPLGLVVCMVAILAWPSTAEAQDDYARTGPYLGVGLGLGFENFQGTGGLDIDTGIGVDAWGGYRFHPNIAAEAQVEYLDRFDAGPLKGNALTFTGNLKGYAMTGRVQPFAVVGVGVTRGEVEAFGGSVSETGFSSRFGGGVDLYISESVSVGATASYVLTTGDIDGFDYVSLVFGVQYRF